MMIEIMGRYPHQSRIAIKNGQYVTESMIQTLGDKGRLMIVIVRNHATGNREVAGNRAEEKHG